MEHWSLSIVMASLVCGSKIVFMKDTANNAQPLTMNHSPRLLTFIVLNSKSFHWGELYSYWSHVSCTLQSPSLYSLSHHAFPTLKNYAIAYCFYLYHLCLGLSMDTILLPYPPNDMTSSQYLYDVFRSREIKVLFKRWSPFLYLRSKHTLPSLWIDAYSLFAIALVDTSCHVNQLLRINGLIQCTDIGKETCTWKQTGLLLIRISIGYLSSSRIQVRQQAIK